MSDQEIGEYLKQLDNESKEIRDNIINLCWWMRGGITHSEAWNLTEFDRTAINKLIKKNLEHSKKSGIPMF